MHVHVTVQKDRAVQRLKAVRPECLSDVSHTMSQAAISMLYS